MGKAQENTNADTRFGEKTVPLADKQALVDDVFHSVARRYDLMNDLMSGGLHRAWKDALVSAVHPPKGDRPFALLDLAGGTGDVAFRVVEAGGPSVRVIVCDINADMLSVGRERARERGHDFAVTFEQGNAEALPEDLGDLVGRHAPQADFTAALEDSVDGEVALEDEVAAVFDLADGIE